MSISNENTLRIGGLIHDVSRLRRTVADRAMRAYGVTWAQGWMLLHLDRHDGQMRQVDLATLLDIGTVALGAQIDRLEERALVERQSDPEDRRSKLLFLTEDGKKLLNEVLPPAIALDHEMSGFLSAEEQAAVTDILQRMKAQLTEMDESTRNGD